MKLIYIANARIPTEKAHGIQIMQMCEAFASLDNNSKRSIDKNLKLSVELIIPYRFNKIKEGPFEYYEIKKVFKIIKLFCIDLIPLSPLLGNLAFWFQTITFLISVKIYLLFKSIKIRRLFFVAIHKPYHILYTREPFVAFFFKDFVLEIHSLPKKTKKFHIKIWHKAKALIVLTEFIKKTLIASGVSEDKILVASDGVDLKKFDINFDQIVLRKEFNLPENKKIIGYIGKLETLEKPKGVDILLKAFEILQNQKFNNLELYLIGGPLKKIQEYKQLCKERNIKNVIFIDHITRHLVPKYLKAFDVLAMPSPWTDFFAYYTSPLKLFEYMASKRPIISSDLPSIREILNKNNAVLVNPDEPEALAKAIKKVLQDSEMANKISKQAFEDVKEYTWGKRVERILKFISKE